MSDIDYIVKLLRTVFYSDFSREWWEWKYISNPGGFHGEEGDIWVAESDDNDVIGHWAIIPQKMKIGSRASTVAQAVDAATSPDYRGRGIFRSLARSVCLDAKNRYDFIFGFPNELYRGYEKLGWKIFPIVEFVHIINYDRPLKSFFKNGATLVLAKWALKALQAESYLSSRLHFRDLTGSDAKLEEVTCFSERMNYSWELARSEHSMVLERNSAFLNWRFSKHFGNYRKIIARSMETGETTGYLVARKAKIKGMQTMLDIVDLNALPGENKSLTNLIEFAIELAKKDEIDAVRCRVPVWHKYARFLRRSKFVSLGKTLERRELYQPRLIVHPLTLAETPDFGRWFYTLADTDNA